MKQLIILVGVIFLLSGGGFVYWYGNREKPVYSFVDAKSGLRLTFSQHLVSETLDERAKKDNFLLRLENGPKEKTDILIRVSYEEGLNVVSSVTKSEIIPLLLGNARKNLPKTFPEFVAESTREFTIGSGQKAGEIVFTYKGPAGQRIKRRLVVVSRDNNTAFYVAAETPEADFTRINKTYFEPIMSSLRF